MYVSYFLIGLEVDADVLQCNADLLQRYYTSLIVSQGAYRQAAEPAVSPFTLFPDAGKPAPTQDSTPATPVDAEGEEAMGSGSEYGSDGDEDEEDCEANGIEEGEAEVEVEVEAETRASEPIAVDERGRGRSRGNTMEVDSPEVRSTPALGQQPPSALSASAAALNSASSPQRAASTDSGKRLKQFVGGIFRRHEPAPTAAASPEKRLKSRPLGEASTTPSSTVVQPTHPPTAADMPKPLTPRVRTREERSVDSLRGAQALPVAVDDSKRRARVE